MTKKKKKKKTVTDVNKKQKKDEKKAKLKSNVKRGIVAVLLFLFAVLFAFGFFGTGGAIGVFLNRLAGVVFGWGKWLFPVTLISVGSVLMLRKTTTFYTVKIIGLIVIFLSLLGFAHIFFSADEFLKLAQNGEGGGYIGYLEASLLLKLTGKVAGIIVLLAFLIIGFMVAFNFSVLEFFIKLFNGKDLKKKSKDDRNDEHNDEKLQNDSKKETSRKLSEEDKEENKSDKANDKPEEKNDEEKNVPQSNIKKIEFVDGPNASEKKKIDNKNDGLSDFLQEKKAAGVFARKTKQKKNKKVNPEWELPPLDLLDNPEGDEIYSGNVERNKEIIRETFANFGIELKDGGVKIGPTVTQYSFRPPVGVKLSKIMALSDNLSLALAVHPIRIEAPIPGKSLIGVEVPNEKGEIIKLRKILESDAFQVKKSGLTLALGEDVEGEYIVADLGEMPHLLVAGATGTGKSVCINSIILSLLFQNSPDDLKLILVDPKRVELSLYDKIPHLLADVIVDNKKVVNALKWAVGEMEKRYKILQSVGSRDLKSYSLKMKQGIKRKYIDPDTGEKVEEELKKIPYVVIVIDELADLMVSHGKEVEGAIMRLTQMARAVGIHLILSTQRPSVEILTGVIKANIGTRIALRVASQVDSRTILDMRGAEDLLGKGDMLFASPDFTKPKRVQSSFVSEAEVKRVVKFIRKQGDLLKKNKKEEAVAVSDKKINDIVVPKTTKTDDAGEMPEKLDFSQSQREEKTDELYEEAKEFVIRAQKASASLLQRRFSIGYNRAARMVDNMEEEGIVAPAEGSKARDVLVDESYLNGNKKVKSGEVSYDDIHKDQEQRDKWQL